MNLRIYPKGSYQIIKVEEDLKVISELPELKFVIEGYLQQGKTKIALSFTNASYIYSGAIAVLIDCYKKIRDGKGELAILEPESEIREIFKYVGIDKLIPIYDTEDDLPLDEY